MTNRLLPLKDKSPGAFYQVIDKPAPLAGMPLPRGEMNWKAIQSKGFKYVVSLESEKPSYDPAPLEILHAVELKDLVSGNPPKDPEREETLIRAAVTAILEKLKAGEGVVVHCYGGRGRTGTVIGCALKKLGYEVQEILTYLDLLHKQRGRPGWPESVWQSDLIKRF